MNDIHDLLGAYCTDALDALERTAFEEHLATCEECRNEAADFRGVLAALADAHPVHPPASLEEAVLTGVRAGGGRHPGTGAATVRGTSDTAGPATDSGPSPARVWPVAPAWRRAAPWLAAAAAGAVLFAGGVGVGLAQGPVESGAPGAPTADMAAVVAVASAADAHVLPVDLMGTTSRLVMSGEMDKTVFLASELPMPAKGMVYQVWTVAEDGQMTSAGSFTPDEDGHIAAVLDCGAAGVVKFMITVEPPGGSENPSGEMLAEIEA